MSMAFSRKYFTVEEVSAYTRRSKDGPCFVCQVVSGTAEYQHHMVYEDENAVAFLNMTQPLYGYTLVAPVQHREQVAADFTQQEFADLQKLIHSVALAVQRTVGPERVYLLSLGSQQGNSHVHWHIAPLPPGVPYEQQQLAALHHDAGVLDMTEEEKARLASRIKRELDSILRED